MYLIVGLGNPGKRYEGSRHNLGFQVVERLSRLLEAGRPSCKFETLVADARYKNNKVLLAQPLTYMNLSGRAVKTLVNYYKIASEKLIVIYDDLDLPPGVIRLRQKGGSGGHRGLESIIAALGTSVFPRLRIGIGSAPGFMETADYVLCAPRGEEQKVLEEAAKLAAEAALCFVAQGLEAAMNKYNSQG